MERERLNEAPDELFVQPPPARLTWRPPRGVCLHGPKRTARALLIFTASLAQTFIPSPAERAGETLDSAQVENIHKSFSEL